MNDWQAPDITGHLEEMRPVVERAEERHRQLLAENAALRTALALVAEAEQDRRDLRRAMPWAALVLVLFAAGWCVAMCVVRGHGPTGTEVIAVGAVFVAGVSWGLALGKERG